MNIYDQDDPMLLDREGPAAPAEDDACDADEPASDDSDDAPVAAYRSFRRDLGGTCALLRDGGGILAAIEDGAWHVFAAIATCWSLSDVAPTRWTLMRRAGVSSRAITRQVRVLRELGVLRIRRSRGGGTEYRIGTLLEDAVTAVGRDLDPKLWPFRIDDAARVLSRSPGHTGHPSPTTLATVAIPPRTALAMVATPPANPGHGGHTSATTLATMATVRRDPLATLAPRPTEVPVPAAQPDSPTTARLGSLLPTILRGAEPVASRGTPAPTRRAPPSPSPAAQPDAPPFKTNKALSSSSSSEEGSRSPRARDDETDRAVACGALIALFQRLHPEQPLPRTFSPLDVALVVECTSGGSWDRLSLEQLHRDAVDGAVASSTGRPPTVRFIWGKLEHFLAHAKRGRAERLANERRRSNRPPPPMEPGEALPPPQVAEMIGAFLATFDSAPEPRRTYRRFDPVDVPYLPSPVPYPDPEP